MLLVPLTLAALVAAAPAPCGPPPLRAGPLPFSPGETLAYDVDVMGVVKAGTLVLSVEPPMSRGQILPLRARVKNTSVFAKMRKVRGVAFSWVEARTLRPERYRDDGEEDGVRKSTDTRITAEGPLTMSWVIGEKQGTTVFEREGPVLDALSTLYSLRAAAVGPGERLCFQVVGNRRFWRLEGAFAPGTERVESAAGIFDTVRFDAVLTRENGPRRPLHLWFTNDARRLPVAVVSEIDPGPVRAMLSAVGGRRRSGD